MPQVWRGMLMENERPRVGRGGNLLGVRVPPDGRPDIAPDQGGFVEPNQGGMSVSPSPERLPPHRIPRRLSQRYPDRFPDARGPEGLFCWSLGEGSPFEAGSIGDRLVLRPDPNAPNRHGFVEPSERMTLQNYETALGETRDHWVRWEE